MFCDQGELCNMLVEKCIFFIRQILCFIERKYRHRVWEVIHVKKMRLCSEGIRL